MSLKNDILRSLVLLLLCSNPARGERDNKAVAFNPNVEEIIVVIKTHFDLGYTHTVDELVPYYRTEMIDHAMTVMDQTEVLPPELRFSWTGPGWVMDKVSEDWDGQDPERKKKIDSYFNSGRFVTHALPHTFEAELMTPEDIARGFQDAVRVSKRYGQALPRDAKMTDVPSHSPILATALPHGGIDFLHIGCNWPSGNVDCPPLFWWEGPDGSRLLTMYSSLYGTCTAFFPYGWGRDKHPGVLGAGFLPPADWPHKVWLALAVTPDNSGPPTLDRIQPLLDEVAEKYPDVKIRVGRMSDFSDAIIASGAELPVVTSDMPDSWIHGCMSDPRGMKTARNLELLLSAAEQAHTQLQDWKVPVDDLGGTINTAFSLSGLYKEHTWGLSKNIKSYGDKFQEFLAQKPKDARRMESSWEDKTDYIHKADQMVRPMMNDGLKALAGNVRADGKRMVVYNPLPWERSGIVWVNGRATLIEKVPAGGYKTIMLGEKPAPARTVLSGNVLENEYLKLTLDPKSGTISSFLDKRSGREWADSSAAEGMGQYLNERFTLEQTKRYAAEYQNGRAIGCCGKRGTDEDWLHPGLHKPGMISEREVPYQTASSSGGTLSMVRNGTAQIATLSLSADPERHLPASELQVTLHDGEAYVDLTVTVKDKKMDNWPMADWLCLPFKVNSPTFCVERTLGMMNPATDILPGANRDMYAVGNGVMLTGADGDGIAVCPLDHPLISLGRPGCWKASRDYVPEKPVVYLNLYNNQWNTNYRYWYSGTISSRVRIWPFRKGDEPGTILTNPSLEARLPLMTAMADGTGGALPQQQEGLSVSRKGVVVTAYGEDPYENKGRLLRLWEHAGISGELEIVFPEGCAFTRAIPVNLRGEPTGEPIAISGRRLVFNMKAYAPASFMLTP